MSFQVTQGKTKGLGRQLVHGSIQSHGQDWLSEPVSAQRSCGTLPASYDQGEAQDMGWTCVTHTILSPLPRGVAG